MSGSARSSAGFLIAGGCGRLGVVCARGGGSGASSGGFHSHSQGMRAFAKATAPCSSIPHSPAESAQPHRATLIFSPNIT